MSRFRRNRALSRQLAQTPQVRRVTEDRARAAQRHAERIAPRDTGAYAASFDVVDGSDGAARLLNSDDAAAYIEFGTKDTPAFAPLRRAVRAAGLRLRGS